jgi:hypothetical protein
MGVTAWEADDDRVRGRATGERPPKDLTSRAGGDDARPGTRTARSFAIGDRQFPGRLRAASVAARSGCDERAEISGCWSACRVAVSRETRYATPRLRSQTYPRALSCPGQASSPGTHCHSAPRPSGAGDRPRADHRSPGQPGRALPGPPDRRQPGHHGRDDPPRGRRRGRHLSGDAARGSRRRG